MSTAPSFLPCSTSETSTRLRDDPLQEVSRPRQRGWGWLSCTQGNVMTKQHIPQFSRGWGKPLDRGASLQCIPAQCFMTFSWHSGISSQPVNPKCPIIWPFKEIPNTASLHCMFVYIYTYTCLSLAFCLLTKHCDKPKTVSGGLGRALKILSL